MANFKRTRPHHSGVVKAYHVNKYKHDYLPLFGWCGATAIALASDAADVSAEDLMLVNGAGDASFGEIASTGINALHIDAAGDDCRLVWPIPEDCDVEYDIQFRVHWSSASTTTTDTITWKVLYKEHTYDSTALTAASTALDTAIAADTNVAGANALQRSPWGILNGGKLTKDRAVFLIVECDAGDMTFASEATYGHYLEIKYVRSVI